LDTVAAGGVYTPAEENLTKINEGLCASVVGSARVNSVINSVYRTNDYRIDPVTALVYGALQDFRARTGENRMTILLSDSHAKHYSENADF
jgi:threonine synthase